MTLEEQVEMAEAAWATLQSLENFAFFAVMRGGAMYQGGRSVACLSMNGADLQLTYKKETKDAE